MNKEIEQIIKDFSEDTRRILRDNLVAKYLFGSTARDEAGKYSDIDILIIVQQFDHQTRKRLSGLSSEYSINHGIYISPTIKDAEIWEKIKTHQTLFYQEIERDGVRLC
jgi:predicted nucleotidyltransferase